MESCPKTHKCIRCGRVKELSSENFYKHKGTKSGFDTTCKACHKARSHELYLKNKETHNAKSREYYQQNKAAALDKSRKWRLANAEKARKHKRDWYERNRELALGRSQKWRETNLERSRKTARQWVKHTRQSSVQYKIYGSALTKLRRFLMARTSTDYSNLVGIDRAGLRSYFEGLFSKDMSWDNYGTKGWTIDHIRPCSSFDLSDESQLLQCFHYTNLQPLTFSENCKKKDK